MPDPVEINAVTTRVVERANSGSLLHLGTAVLAPVSTAPGRLSFIRFNLTGSYPVVRTDEAIYSQVVSGVIRAVGQIYGFSQVRQQTMMKYQNSKEA